MDNELLSKPFPWKCRHCGSRSVNPAVIDFKTDADHDGRTYTVDVPALQVFRCGVCNELVLDDAANRRISDSLRKQIGVLTPSQIRKHRESLGLTQKELSRQLGIAEATLSRWETGGQIQQRALDKLLRLYFGCDAAREFLSGDQRSTHRLHNVSVTSIHQRCRTVNGIWSMKNSIEDSNKWLKSYGTLTRNSEVRV